MRNSKTFLVCYLIIFSLALNAQTGRQVKLFNENWKFHKGDVPGAEKVNLPESDWKAVDLPHDWSIEEPFDQQWASATGYLPGGIGWYRKTFNLPANLQSKKVFLYFDGVYKNSEVWINGHFLGKRPNGFIPFQYEITSYLNKYGNNVLAVKADHSDFADSRWYTGSGIYRNVYLVATEPVHIEQWGVQLTTPTITSSNATANVSVSVLNESTVTGAVNVKAQLVDAAGKQVGGVQKRIVLMAGSKSNVVLGLNILKPHLWSPENPYLYNLIVTVYSKGKPADIYKEKVGIRSFRFDAATGFFLNGTGMKMKGVCIHDDAGALGVAVPEEVWIRRLKTLKEGGCNALRMSHNPHADYLYNLADSMGFLVMDEAFDEWELGKNKWIKGWNVGTPGKDGYHTYFKEWSDKDVEDMVARNRNHPSIVLWSIGNEIDYPNDPYTHPVLDSGRNPQIYGRGYSRNNPSAARLTEIARKLVADVKKMDTTRPVTAALAGVVMSNEVGYPEVLDVVGYNYQEYRYPEDHAKYPSRVIYGSENGMAYSAWKAVEDNDYICGQFLWTGVDYLGEARTWPSRSNMAGLLDLAGFKKPQYYFRKSLWSQVPMAWIGTAAFRNSSNRRIMISPSWNYTPGDSARVTCFTNCEEAELFINGYSQGRRRLADFPEKIINWNVVYQPGEVVIKAYNNGKEDAFYAIKTAAQASAIEATVSGPPLKSWGRQLAQVELQVTDENSVPVPDASDDVTVTVTGPAKLMGLESGSSVSHEDYKANHRKTLNGRLLAYVQSTGATGPIKVTVSAPGLKSKHLSLR